MGLDIAVNLPRLCVYFAPVPPQTLYLASMLIKALWNNALAAKAQLSKQSSFASLLNTNIPMGNKKGASGLTVTKKSHQGVSACFYSV